ncbi:MAG: hypothetical protein RIR00_651 [Pseudomonadota bacterium]|jgi:RNA polymerase sigma-70 factor (ECF subfamily)
MSELHDPEFLQQLRRDMLRFAELQLRDRATAEDAVQEALTAALANQAQFASRAALRTWMLTILRNKIIDSFRQRSRRETVEVATVEQEIDEFFDEREHWDEDTRPVAWGDPEASLNARRFWEMFEACLYRLPETPARVFLMREVVGCDTGEICTQLEITDKHCWVLLHRARLGLRACLGHQWFGEGQG